MAVVMINCPQTGVAVSTGIETDQTTFERLPDAEVRLLCPRCGQTHIWRKANATLVDGPRGPSGSQKS